VKDICNIELEQAILGTIMVTNDALVHVRGHLEADHFFEPAHRRLFEVICDMTRKGQVANPLTVQTFLPDLLDKLRLDDKKATVSAYLARCAAMADPMGLVTSAVQVKDMAKRRRVVSILEDALKEYRNVDVDVDPNELGERVIGVLSSTIADGAGVYGSISFGEALDDGLHVTDAAYAGRRPAGLPHGFSPVDKLIGSFSPGQLIILGGATKQGKSALAGQLARGAAKAGSPVWFYSGEMSAMELAMRENSRQTRVSVSRQKRGKVVEADFERLVQYRDENRDLPLFIQEKRLTLEAIKERAKMFVRKMGQGLVIIDHIGLVDRDRGQKSMQEWEFGQEVTLFLKQMAREIDCPVIGCAQLKKNTFVERGPLTEKFLHQLVARRPRYSDLIGAVERDADHVIMPFRPVVFLKEHEPPPHSDLHLKWEEMVNEHERKAKIVLALSRESQWPRDADCGWDGATTTFFETGGMQEDDFQASHTFAADPMRLI